MHASHLLGAAAAAVVVTVLLLQRPAERVDAAAPPAAATAAPLASPTPPAPPRANGHDVLVVEGDRDGLAVSFARHKAAPWGGAPKGLDTGWLLTVRDAAGEALAEVPLDVRPFATGAAHVGRPARVHGCVVVDSRIGMLVNVPTFAAAARYDFTRTGADGRPVAVGAVTAARVRELTGGGK